MRKIILILTVVSLFFSCSLPRTEVQSIKKNGKTYKCVNLNDGIFEDSEGKRYNIGYQIDGKNLKFYMVEKK